MKRKTKKQMNQINNTLSSIIKLLSYSYIGKMILYSFIAIIVIAITIALTGNDYDKFFTALGVEVLIVTIFGWILYLAFRNMKSR
ncbi:MAG: hypothetical protein ACYCYI_09110 [Saccharofermentanales bacterium]